MSAVTTPRLRSTALTTLALVLAAFLAYASGVKLVWLANDPRAQAGRVGAWLPYAIASLVELALAVALLMPRWRALTAWAGAWAFVGVGAASWLHGLVVGTPVGCRCLGTVTRAQTLLIVDGILVIAFATLAFFTPVVQREAT